MRWAIKKWAVALEILDSPIDSKVAVPCPNVAQKLLNVVSDKRSTTSQHSARGNDLIFNLSGDF
jgi:hypothetical protein